MAEWAGLLAAVGSGALWHLRHPLAGAPRHLAALAAALSLSLSVLLFASSSPDPGASWLLPLSGGLTGLTLSICARPFAPRVVLVGTLAATLAAVLGAAVFFLGSGHGA